MSEVMWLPDRATTVRRAPESAHIEACPRRNRPTVRAAGQTIDPSSFLVFDRLWFGVEGFGGVRSVPACSRTRSRPGVPERVRGHGRGRASRMWIPGRARVPRTRTDTNIQFRTSIRDPVVPPPTRGPFGHDSDPPTRNPTFRRASESRPSTEADRSDRLSSPRRSSVGPRPTSSRIGPEPLSASSCGLP